MSKVYLATKDDLNQTRIDLAARFAIAEQGESAAVSVTGDTDCTPVGRVVFDCVLRQGYVKANGATVANASQDYPLLVEFVLAHPELIAADDEAYAANTALYMYNVTSDVMTLPNYIGRVMQGGNSVESIEAGLPNIVGGMYNVPIAHLSTAHWTGAFKQTAGYASTQGAGTAGNNVDVVFSASYYNSIFSDNVTTVQPPAITLIPQIRY